MESDISHERHNSPVQALRPEAHPDPRTPIDQTIRVFGDLLRQGKIRYYALSTFNGWLMTEAVWTADRLEVKPPVCNQIACNLANRDA